MNTPGEFSEIDLNDHVTPNDKNGSPENIRSRRKPFSSALKLLTTSPSSVQQSNPLAFLDNSFHESISSTGPPTSGSLLESNGTGSSNSSRCFPSSSLPGSPPPTSISSDSNSSSPQHLPRANGSHDLTRRTFQFPISRHDSLIDSLLSAIYEREGNSYALSSSQDSDTITIGELTDQSLYVRRLSGDSTSNNDSIVFSRSNLINRNIYDLRHLTSQLQLKVAQANGILVKHLRQRDKSLSKLQRNCDMITAILQAASLKRREDTTMRFSLTPYPGEKGFQQWKDAISVAIRIPGGLPAPIRQKLWISLASNYIREIHLDWPKTCRFAFNNCSNPDDDQLGIQIVKDLHRTGCSWSANERDRATLKRVLLAFARYNKSIGYCQGLNILAAVILDVVDMNEEYGLMILIYLVDSILPNFFTNNLRALAIDMAVFREWLRIYHGKLHEHLQKLQSSSQDASGTIYEPPLLNVFTIQWFLTLFATCLPRVATLRVWDALMIEGNEILFRTGLVLWSKLAISVLKVPTADQFYSAMAHLSVQLLDEKIISADHLIRDIYNFGPFPTPMLSELRQKFSFNITPFQQLTSSTTSPTDQNDIHQTIARTTKDEFKSQEKRRSKGKTNVLADDETSATADEEMANFMSCFAILSASSRNNRSETYSNESAANNSTTALSRLTPGAYSNLPTTHKTSSIEDSLSLDISQLRKQYKKLQDRNKQVQIILQTATNEQRQRIRTPSINSSSDSLRRATLSSIDLSSTPVPANVCSISSGPLVNHLLIKPTDLKRNQLKTTVSMRSTSTSSASPMIERQTKPFAQSVQLAHADDQRTPRSKQEEIEDAAELQQEIDQLLTSLNLEKTTAPIETIAEPVISHQHENSLENVARTLYDQRKNQVTISEKSTADKKQTPNLIDRLLTSRAVQIPKYSSFNPFPSRSFNENVAVNGYKLGLYAPDLSNR